MSTRPIDYTDTRTTQCEHCAARLPWPMKFCRDACARAFWDAKKLEAKPQARSKR